MDIKPHDNEKGFTLVELLVALALAGIVSTAIYASFNSQERVYKAQQLIVEMQQNIKSAMLIATKEVRMANAYLGDNGLEWHDNSGAERNILGFQAYNNSANGTDAIDMANADFTLKTYIEKDMPKTSSELDVVSVKDQETGAVFQEGMFAIIADKSNKYSDLMEITTVQGDNNPSSAQKLQRNPAATSGLNEKDLFHDYDVGDVVFAAKLVSFRIINDDPDHPYLGIAINYNPNKTPAEREADDEYIRLVEDIEDLQIVYIFKDGDETNEPDNETDGDTTNDYNDIASIRLSIVARTREPVRGFSGSAPIDLEDHDVTNTQDGYHRRVLTEEIVVRNFDL